jgi:GNAT superfamily N-acetyltransferase
VTEPKAIYNNSFAFEEFPRSATYDQEWVLENQMNPNAVTVRSLSNRQIGSFLGQFVRIYRDAFAAPPYCKGEQEVADFAQSLPQHGEREGFRLVAAVAGTTGDPVGFAYGFKNTPGQLWHQEVARAIRPQVVAEWLMDSFRLVEIAVAPGAQGHGIGGLLHDHLLNGLPYRRAVLSTLAAETNAHWMYLKRGWAVLLDEIIFPGAARPYRVMGRDGCAGDRI